MKPDSSRQAQALEVLGMIRQMEADPPRYCAVMAMLAANVDFPFAEHFTAKYSAEDKARAIPFMENMKSRKPDLTEWIDNGIVFVQENWMKEVTP